jgi:catecholate siderophore receptor
VGAIGRVNDRWEVLANYGYFNTEQRSQNSATNGLRLTLTPQRSGSVWTTYALPVKLTIGGGVRFTDEVFINAANTIRLPGYRIVDAMAEYEVTQSLGLRFNVTNLTNNTYIKSINNNGGRYNPGQPRAFLLTTNFKF